MTPEELKQIADHPQGDISAPSTPGKLGSFGAGAASGVTLGIAGNYGPMADYATRAQQANPLTYGAGYLGGTAFGMLGGPELLAGKAISKLAPEATSMAGLGMKEASPTGAQAGFQAIKNYVSPVTDKVTELAKPLTDNLPKWIKAIPDSNAGSAAGSVIPRVANPIAGPEPQPQPLPAGSYGAAEPETSDTQTASVQPFSAIADFLAQAQDSNNPAVQQAATQAQQGVDPNDPNSAQQIAMALQTTPEGRAVGNSDSIVHDQDEEEA